VIASYLFSRLSLLIGLLTIFALQLWFFQWLYPDVLLPFKHPLFSQTYLTVINTANEVTNWLSISFAATMTLLSTLYANLTQIDWSQLTIVLTAIIGVLVLSYLLFFRSNWLKINVSPTNLQQDLDIAKRHASGFIDESNTTKQSQLLMQLSAIQTLGELLKQQYPKSIRKQSFEILRTLLQHHHKRILATIETPNYDLIQQTIEQDSVCKELNAVIESHWQEFLQLKKQISKTVSLVGIRLPNSNIAATQVPLQYCDLQGMDLSKSILNGIDLQGANLQYVRLSQASLVDVNAHNCHFSHCLAQFANFRSSNLVGIEWVNGSALGVDFSNAFLLNARFCKVNLSATTWIKTKAQAITIDDCSLFGSQCKKALFYAANFANSKVSGSLFKKCHFEGTTDSPILSGENSQFLDRITQRLNQPATFGSTVFIGGYSKFAFAQDEQLMQYYCFGNEQLLKQYRQWYNRVVGHIEVQPNFRHEAVLSQSKTQSYGELILRLSYKLYHKLTATTA